MEDHSEAERQRLREELGFQRWQALGHFLTEASYLGFNRGDYRGAVEQCEKAWSLFETGWQQETGGGDVLIAMVDFALRSGDAALVAETLAQLSDRASQVGNAELDEAIQNLAQLSVSGRGSDTE